VFGVRCGKAALAAGMPTGADGETMMVHFLRFVQWLADALKALAVRLDGFVDKELKRKFEAKE